MESITPFLTCFGLGLAAALHPCAIAVNAAAIGMLSAWVQDKHTKLKSTGFFIGGYVFSYLLLGIVFSVGITSFSQIAQILDSFADVLLGPILIVVGMIHAKLINTKNFFLDKLSKKLESKLQTKANAFPVGMLLAISFCPATALLFFGGLIPLASEHNQPILFPVIYALAIASTLFLLTVLVNKGISKAGSNIGRGKHSSQFLGWGIIAIGIFITVERIYL